jgi:hypothetical protein
VTGVAGFGRTLVFAACAGVAAPLGIGVLQALVGPRLALPGYVIAVAATYAAGLARRPGDAVGAAAAVVLAGGLLVVGGGSLSALAVGCAVAIGALRSAWLRRDPRKATPAVRGIAIEAVLIGVGLVFAAWLGGGTFHPVPLAIWGFFLVQSAFFAIGGPAAQAAREAPHGDIDPFDAAHRRAMSLLEDAPRR